MMNTMIKAPPQASQVGKMLDEIAPMKAGFDAFLMILDMATNKQKGKAFADSFGALLTEMSDVLEQVQKAKVDLETRQVSLRNEVEVAASAKREAEALMEEAKEKLQAADDRAAEVERLAQQAKREKDFAEQTLRAAEQLEKRTKDSIARVAAMAGDKD